MANGEDRPTTPAHRLPRIREHLHDDPPRELAQYEVDWDRLRASHLADLEAVLADAGDERPLQRFLTEQPHVLMMGVIAQQRQAWVLSKPRFGAEYVPDFLIGIQDSLGPGWMPVELESPRMDPLREDGAIRNGLHHAVQQIQDYRRWLADNAAYFRAEHGCWGIEAGCAATIVIGRREMRDNRDGVARIRDLRRDKIEVMSYDRLVLLYGGQSAWLLETLRRVEDLTGPN